MRRKRADERARKGAMLFANDANPLWETLREIERLAGRKIRPGQKPASSGGAVASLDTTARNDRQSHPHEWLRVSRPVVDDWKRGELANPDLLLAGAQLLRDELTSISKASADPGQPMEPIGRARIDRANELADGAATRLDAFVAAWNRHESVLRVGEALGMTADAARNALDAAFDRMHPLFQLPYFASKGEAERSLRNLRGTHLTWLFRSGRILQCTTRFRYVVAVRGGHAIRVKLNLPRVNPTPDQIAASKGPGGVPPQVEYDGWIMWAQASRVFVSLETRGEAERSDMLHLVIDAYENGRERFRGGNYLTVDQDNAQSVVAGRLLMQHLPPDQLRDEDEAARSAFMRRDLQVIDEGDPEFARLHLLLGASPGQAGAPA